METEHSLLDQISRKEAELKDQCDIACKEAETRIHDARVRARSMREDAEQKGAMEASQYMQSGLDELAIEIRSILAAGEAEADKILKTGETKVDNAVNRITEMVLG
ncbi:V-type ATPase subunit subunit G family protein [Methanospirillum hungatei]|uniref:V-type ATPase subunit subunit G family protein n=1 Tax=Methanospirillum hungatei TaxID=2203 RepID=UPI0026EAFFF6|nr:V-type ATPase subunit subunit G family protein [Methanospirillum hungatei]MCA1914871.1 hypothetical protein [Methanospirillum hungatei]